MLRYGMQQPYTFRWSRPHASERRYLLFLPKAYAVLKAHMIVEWRSVGVPMDAPTKRVGYSVAGLYHVNAEPIAQT
jgi:hypothetical protein